MIFKTDIYKISSNNVKKFPIGTPKIIIELKKGDEVYFEMDPRDDSSKTDIVTMYNLTNKSSHSMKKGNLFRSIQGIGLALK